MIINGKEYTKIAEYPNHILFKDKNGNRECFQKHDLIEHKEKKNTITKFNLFDNGEFKGIYTISELEEIIGKPRTGIYSAMYDRRIYEGRWKIERV